MKKLLGITLLALVVSSQVAMATNEGPSGYEAVLPGYSSADVVVYDNLSYVQGDDNRISFSSNEGSGGYEELLPGYNPAASLELSKVSFFQGSEKIIDIFDTNR